MTIDESTKSFTTIRVLHSGAVEAHYHGPVPDLSGIGRMFEAGVTAAAQAAQCAAAAPTHTKRGKRS